MKPFFRSLLAALNEWRAQRKETAFERGYWESVQRADAALLPLSQIGCRTADAFTTSPRPGTLTIAFGDDRVTLDPLSSHEKYIRDRAKADELLERMRAAAAEGKVA